MADPFEFLNRHIDVPRETFDKLKIYHDLLLKWQAKINLVGPDSINDSWSRHFLDSLQLVPHVDLHKTILDLGTGAGFPGMIFSIMGGDKIHLVESDRKKIVFLSEVSRLTGCHPSLHNDRIEKISLPEMDCICARALADLKKLLSYSAPFVSRETICLFPKGKNYAMEIEDASRDWSFDVDIIPSITDQHGVILKLSNISKRA